MAAEGTVSHIFIDDITEVYRHILSVHVQPNASIIIGRLFILQQDNCPKHIAKATNYFFKAKNGQFLSGQVNRQIPIEHAFHMLKRT